MRKLNSFLILTCVALLGVTTGCEDPIVLEAPTPPTINVTVDKEGNEFKPGSVLTFTIEADTTEGVLQELTITPSIESGSGPALGSHVYNTTEDVTYVYVVPFS